MRCPRCKTPIGPDNDTDWLPFCSRRCQLIDLGAWLEEKHAIPGDEELPQHGDDEDIDKNPH